MQHFLQGAALEEHWEATVDPEPLQLKYLWVHFHCTHVEPPFCKLYLENPL